MSNTETATKKVSKAKLKKTSLENLSSEVIVENKEKTEKKDSSSIKTNSFEDLKSIKQDFYKKEKVEETPEEKLLILNKRFLRTQNLQDEILGEVYNELKEDLITNFEPQTIKVYRANQLYFCTTDTKFKFGNRNYYICSHNKKDSTVVLQFIEEETILEGYNIKLRDISPRIYKK